MKRIITGMEFSDKLVELGIIPPNSGDIIIEVPVSGVVIFHFSTFADERLLEVLPATVDPAQIKDVTEPTNDQIEGWMEKHFKTSRQVKDLKLPKDWK